MARLKDPILDLLNNLSAIQVTNKDGSTVDLYARVWNNQIRYEEEGKLYDFPKPACFVEIVSPVQFQVIGQGYRSADLAFRLHLCQEDYNTEGTFEQDITIFDLRDLVIEAITGRKLSGCGPLDSTGEGLDYEHTNIYHYIVDFVANFTDVTGSRLNPDMWDAYQQTTPPTDLEIDTTVETAVSDKPGLGYVIPKRS